MPIYDFKCPKCGTIKELRIEINGANPKCDNNHLAVEMERQFPTGTSFVLKGGGWAKDNYSSSK